MIRKGSKVKYVFREDTGKTYLQGSNPSFQGLVGTVVQVTSYRNYVSCGVDFNRINDFTHNLQGLLKGDTGYWVDSRLLREEPYHSLPVVTGSDLS